MCGWMRGKNKNRKNSILALTFENFEYLPRSKGIEKRKKLIMRLLSPKKEKL